MEDSLFTKIIKGEIPAHKVYEDERTLAFMDIYPIKRGAVLVVPKTQVDHFFDVPTEDYLALMHTVRKVAQRMKEVFPEASRIGVIIEGFEVPHTHVKLVPITSGVELRMLPDMSKEPDHAELEALAEKLRF
jgi:histidine triad (HIT) family protein